MTSDENRPQLQSKNGKHLEWHSLFHLECFWLQLIFKWFSRNASAIKNHSWTDFDHLCFIWLQSCAIIQLQSVVCVSFPIQKFSGNYKSWKESKILHPWHQGKFVDSAPPPQPRLYFSDKSHLTVAECRPSLQKNFWKLEKINESKYKEQFLSLPQ